MNPASASATTDQPLPPVGETPTFPQGAPQGGAADPMAAIMSGIAPIKSAVDAINSACKQVVQSGAVPGSEQVCGQIIALAQSLLPMAAQNMLQPTGGQGQGGPAPAGAGIPPAPGGPPPLGS